VVPYPGALRGGDGGLVLVYSDLVEKGEREILLGVLDALPHKGVVHIEHWVSVDRDNHVAKQDFARGLAVDLHGLH
jgi:hypothetical protein